MAWSSWMCIERTPELDFELEKGRVMVQEADHEKLQDFTINLYQAWLLQQKVLQQAVRRIAELECREALSGAVVPKRQGWRGRLLGLRPFRAG